MTRRALVTLATLLASEPAHAQMQTAAFVQLTAASYAVDAGYGVDWFHGALLGGGVVLGFGPRVSVRVLAEGGALSARSDQDLERRIGYVAATASWLGRPWLRAQAGLSLRTLANAAALHRAIAVHIGAEARPAFSHRDWHGIIGLRLMPIVAASGLPPASFGLAGTAGMEFQRGTISLVALYTLERVDFPAGGALRRYEQMTGLTVRGGLRIRP